MRSLLLSAMLIVSGSVAGQTLSYTFPTDPGSWIPGDSILFPCAEPWQGASLGDTSNYSGFNGSDVYWQGVTACYDSGMVTTGWEVLGNEGRFIRVTFSANPEVLIQAVVIECMASPPMRLRVDYGETVIGDAQLSDNASTYAFSITDCTSAGSIYFTAYNGTGPMTIEAIHILALPGPCDPTSFREVLPRRVLMYDALDGHNLIGQKVREQLLQR